MDDAHESMYHAGWSDGLPLVPPTAERVRRMLSGTARDAGESLGLCPPMYCAVAVKDVAANAVMAGCEPRHLRIVLAAVEAMLAEPFNLHGVHATTMGATPVVIVNGPARVDAGLNSSIGAMGSGTRANVAIGRALKLIVQNIGGARLGGTESTTLGTPMKFGLTVAENEEVLLATSSWLPYHASNGVDASASRVTVIALTSGPHQLVDFATRDAATLLALLGSHVATGYAAHLPLINEALVVISPEHLRTLHRGGVASKRALAVCLWHCANRAASRHILRTLRVAKPNLSAALLLVVGAALSCVAFSLSLVADLVGYVAPAYALAALPLHSLVLGRLLGAPKLVSPAALHVVVAGGRAGKFSSVCMGFGVGKPPAPTANLSRACSAAVEPAPSALDAAPDAAALPPAEHSLATLVNPTSRNEAVPLVPAKRLGTLDDATLTVGLLDISKAGGAILLDRLQRRLRADYPHLTCKRLRKPTFSRPMPHECLAELRRCSAVVAALAD